VIERLPGRVRFLVCSLSFCLSVSCTPSLAAEIPYRYWDGWDRAARQQCPSHHLELLGDIYDELISDFSKTLPSSVNEKATAIADYSRQCTDETAGFYCEMSTYIHAYKKLGLLGKFTAFSCYRYKCLEGAYRVDPQTGKFR
jgi:hypothetical protein